MCFILLKQFSKTRQTCVRKSSCSIVIIFFTSCSKFLHISSPYRDKVGHHSKIKSQGPCENEFKMFCLNGGDCYYLVDEDIVGCNCIWLYGGKRCGKYMWWD